MDAAVDEEGARLDRVLALDDVAVAVGHHQVGRRDLRPVQALRIDQEQLLAAGHGHAEVIAHALVQAMRAAARSAVVRSIRAWVTGSLASINERSVRADMSSRLAMMLRASGFQRP